jgi:fused signal recognition particle receptor
LTKLDGTAKGGVVIAIARELNLPIRYIGVGEKVDDLLPFEAESFVASLFE